MRRLSGEPLAWITGRAAFGDLTVRVDPGVYVPRWQSLGLARRASARLPETGSAIDLCTGSGAVAAALRARRPTARIVATDCDGRAVACARANGIEAYRGDLFAAVPPDLRGGTDVIVAVVPYVPSTELRLLPRDTLAFEDAAHYDGGLDGTDLLRRVVTDRAELPAAGREPPARAGRRPGRPARSHAEAPRVRLGADLDRRGRRSARAGGDARPAVMADPEPQRRAEIGASTCRLHRRGGTSLRDQRVPG